MEKVKSICVMKELLRSVSELEKELQEVHGLSFNESMVVCCIGEDLLTASVISENTGLTPSHTSKVIRSIEVKGLVERIVGASDRRQMLFQLTEDGRRHLLSLKTKEIRIPEFIRPLFDSEPE